MVKRFSNLGYEQIKKSLPLTALFAAILIIIIFFVYGFISQEKYIYFWDYSTYFGLYNELGEKISNTPLKAIDSVSSSIRKADYNNSGVVLLMPFYFIFGSGRIAYISAIAVTYGFSIIVLFSFLTRKFVSRNYEQTISEKLFFTIISAICVGFLPQFWIPVLLGYIDVAGVGIIFLIFYLYFRKNLADQSRRSLIGIGILLAVLIILRRWYAYWVVGFFVAATVYELLFFLKNKTENSKSKTAIKHFSIIGISSLIFFFIFATQISIRMITTDYADIYSAYKQSVTITQDFQKLYGHFGLLTLATAIGGAVTMFLKRDQRLYAIFLSVLFVVTFYLFTRTQDIDLHHYYWIISILVVLTTAFWLNIFTKLKNIYWKNTFVLLVLVFSTANFSVVFFPRADNTLKSLSFMFPKARLYPKVRNDLEEVHKLLIKLSELTQSSDKKIYVLSSSISLNSSLLSNGSYQFEEELKHLKKKILQGNDVDKRDGFPFQLYKADYVVVADPPGFHLQPADQKVVGVIAEKFLKQQNIGRAYTKLPFTFILDDGRQAFIFQKERKNTREELKEISQEFVNYYPERREKFEITEEMLNEYGENLPQ